MLRPQVVRFQPRKNSTMPNDTVSLVNLVADEERQSLLKDLSLSLPDLSLNARQMCDLELLATGVFSPLDRFMSRSDYESVLDRIFSRFCIGK